MPKAKAAALKAIDLDDTLAGAHATLALLRFVYDFNHAGAEKEFHRALELKPSDATAHVWYSLYLAAMGRFDEAATELNRAQELDPGSPALNGYAGAILYYAHRYDEVIRKMQPLIEKNPDYQQPYAWIALAYEQMASGKRPLRQWKRAPNWIAARWMVWPNWRIYTPRLAEPRMLADCSSGSQKFPAAATFRHGTSP